MGRALKSSDAYNNAPHQGEVASGIFASLEALKTIAKGANLMEIHGQLEGILTSSVEVHVAKLYRQLDARR